MLDFIKNMFVVERIDCPFQSSTTKPKPASRVKTKKPDNLVYTLGKAYLQTEKEDGFECEVYNGADKGRSNSLTKYDIELIEKGQYKTTKLKETKYIELKPFWSSGLSAIETTRTFKGKRGYGQRTIEGYFAAMNYADSLLELSKTLSQKDRKTA